MNNIKTIREKSGMQQSQLAEVLGLTQGAISQWEIGLTTPSIDNLKKLASIFGCTVDELLADPKEAA
mgnify:CR=1 FL=1